MAEDPATEPVILRDLGDGLILRRATRNDAEALAAFNGEVHRSPDATEPVEGIAAWTRDLMRGDHPTFAPGDFTVVEDTRTRAIVSTLNLISQRWSYGGVEFGVGRPELVGTHPDYRRRGLVRAQFEVIHRWSADRNEKMQAITGIPWYYRQFGYEYALALDVTRLGSKSLVPQLKEGQAEPYRLRTATDADLPFLAQLYERAVERSLVACVRDEALWRYEFHGRSEKSGLYQVWQVIETAEGEPVGFLDHASQLWGTALATTIYELEPGSSWLAVTPSVLRYLRSRGEEYAVRDHREFEEIAFRMGTEHPVYEAVPDRLPRTQPPYAWYVRVPDLPGFLRHISPVLERRLAESVAVGHTGELKLSFYRDGLRMVFERGRLVAAEAWAPIRGEPGVAAFPDRTFLRLLFGYRGLEEMEYAFPDCRPGSSETRAVLKALFPRRPSSVWPVA
ncbi:MAG: GNAT family N-acetyltransferase [Chloroflexi bacterium]|nr:GNAT family N-acetyltransferase [Chloroflexota bacterium]